MGKCCISKSGICKISILANSPEGRSSITLEKCGKMMYYHVLPKIPPAVPAIVLNQWTKTPYAGFLSGLIRYKSLQIYQHNTNWSHHPTPWNVLKKGVSGSRRGCFTSPGSLRPPETSIASLLSGLTPIRRF